MRTPSRALRVTCIALASALCVPASAAPDGNGKSDALTDGLMIVRYNTPEACAAARANDRLRNAGPKNADPKQHGEWIADVERPAEASKGLDAGMKQLDGQDKLGNQQFGGRGVDIARVDGEIVSPGQQAGKTPTTRPLGIVPGEKKPRPAASGEKGGTEDINIGVGELQESRGGVSIAAGDVTGDGSAC